MRVSKQFTTKKTMKKATMTRYPTIMIKNTATNIRTITMMITTATLATKADIPTTATQMMNTLMVVIQPTPDWLSIMPTWEGYPIRISICFYLYFFILFYFSLFLFCSMVYSNNSLHIHCIHFFVCFFIIVLRSLNLSLP